MFEDIFLYGLREERMARAQVEQRLRARQLGAAWVGLVVDEGKPHEATQHQAEAHQEAL